MSQYDGEELADILIQAQKPIMKNITILIAVSILIVALLLILDCFVSDVDCIVNNGNILTDGRWKCHYHLQKRICWRE